MFISPAYAQGAAAPDGMGAILGSPLVMIVLMFVIFYFLLIRPQQKRLKEHQNMIANLRRGDVVVTAGGLVGKITKVEEDEVEVDLGGDTKVRAIKGTLSDVRSKTEPAKAKADNKAEAKAAAAKK